MAELRGGLGTLRQKVKLARCRVFGTSLALARLEPGTTTVCCWVALAALKMALLVL